MNKKEKQENKRLIERCSGLKVLFEESIDLTKDEFMLIKRIKWWRNKIGHNGNLEERMDVEKSI